ncbi:MAG: 50S ribosomal protein L29 [Actinobacteria bacterium]|nr:50S ribosomal protein L29 [Actinomycetota bacterium]
MKARDLRILDEEDLAGKLRELKETLFNLRFQHATGQLENPMKIKEIRQDIARVCTVMTEREFNIHPSAFEEAVEYAKTAPKEEPAEEKLEMEEIALEEPAEDEDTGEASDLEDEIEEKAEEDEIETEDEAEEKLEQEE